MGEANPDAAADEWRANQDRLCKMTWRERGAHDLARGIPREPRPCPAGTPEGDDWRAGWDEEAQGAAPEDGHLVFRMAPVGLLLKGGQFHLVDSQGRQLGAQVYIKVEQAEHGHNVTVTFSGVEIEVEAPQCTP